MAVGSVGDHRLDSARGWWVVGSAAVAMFTVFGVAYSFGAFFTSMAEEFDTGSGATALVFSVTISLSFVAGPWTGRWADRVGPRPVLLTAAVSLAAGLLLTAAVPNILLGYATHGVGVGFALACGYVPMVSTVGGWFETRRATTLGVAVSGIGLGTLVGSFLAARLIAATTWRTTYVIFALVGAGLLVGASLVAEKGPAAVQAPRPRPLGELLRVREFTLLYLSTMLTTLGLFVPFVFIVPYAEDRAVSEVAAATLVGLIGGASVVGRLALGRLADRVGIIRLYRSSVLVVALSHLLWLVAGDNYPTLVVNTLVLGVGYGGFIALSPAVTAQQFGLEGLGGVLGTLYTSAAIGSLFGPPLAGVLIEQFGHRTAILSAVAVSLAAVAFLVPLVDRTTE